MKNVIVVIIILNILTILSAKPVNQVPNLQNPQYDIYTAGQPTEEGFQQVAAMGIKTVINVLPERYCLPGEAEMVVANNMTYRTQPFQTSEFRKETILQFADLLKNSKKPVLIHCSTGNHVGGLWFAYRVLKQRIPLSQALEEGRKIGMRPVLEGALLDWIVSQDLQSSS
jgi:uncharacterized protein (TIGR01244 family)